MKLTLKTEIAQTAVKQRKMLNVMTDGENITAEPKTRYPIVEIIITGFLPNMSERTPIAVDPTT